MTFNCAAPLAFPNQGLLYVRDATKQPQSEQHHANALDCARPPQPAWVAFR